MMFFSRIAIFTIALTQACSMQTDDKQPNRLINATSPYLLQHAYNPVDWYEWGEEALSKARKENKPLLVSIGYSSCHWCHVMEHESFEDKDIAAIMNENFVCIKVDREERPDIDQIYMEAVQAMGINGGWPLNVFITPDQKPFYGGTYFPPTNWSQLLLQISKAYKDKRDDINSSADELARRLAESDLDRFRMSDENSVLTVNGVDQMFKSLQSKFDYKWGGIDKAPKFVMPTQWLFLLRHYAKTGNQESLNMVTLTLKKMAMGGLYDHVGGGFARYSVDGRWFAPHFEKMLYDNAQLLSLCSEAYRVTKDDFYRRVVYETLDWLKREMTSSEGGFYSALDADSEGEEGKYYVWTKAEFDSIASDQPKWLAEYFTITDQGNWEHGNNILFVEKWEEEFIQNHKISREQLHTELAIAKAKLLSARNERIRPGLDDKVLTGWNAMTIHGLLDAYAAFGDESFLNLAVNNIHFLEKNLIDKKIFRSFKGKRSPVEGFLEDYAFIIQAYLSLYHSTFDEVWLDKADRWAAYTQTNFYDNKEGYYHFTGNKAEELIARKKEIFDNVIPSSNGVMARNLFHLGILLDNKEYKVQAQQMVAKIHELIESEPAYMSHWAMLYAEMIAPMAEVVVVSPELNAVSKQWRENYVPFSLIMGTKSNSDLPLLREKVNPDGKDATIYVCYNSVCKLPVHTVNEALGQLSTTQNR